MLQRTAFKEKKSTKRSYENVLFTVPTPLPMGSSGRQYKLASNIVEDIVKKFKNRVSK